MQNHFQHSSKVPSHQQNEPYRGIDLHLDPIPPPTNLQFFS